MEEVDENEALSFVRDCGVFGEVLIEVVHFWDVV